MATDGEPCGAHAVTEWIEGTPRVLKWCDRVAGPCPFRGVETQHEVNARRERAYPLITRDERVERPCAVRSGAFDDIDWLIGEVERLRGVVKSMEQAYERGGGSGPRSLRPSPNETP